MIAFCCPGCRKTFQVKDDLAGRTTACPACQQSFIVPPSPTPAPRAAATSPPDIFVSYARKDEGVVYPIATRLRAQGVRLWIDKLDILPGDCFRTEITRAIDRCKLLWLMCSEQSLASDFCFKEVTYASNKKRPVACLWLCPPCPMPGKFELELGHCHQIVLAKRTAESWLPELLRSLGKHRVAHRAGEGSQARSLDPAEKQRREQLPQWRLAIQEACQRRDWQTVLDRAQPYLEVMPNDAEILTAASTASQWLSYEQNQLFSRVRSSREASAWTDFLARYPDGPASDHARRKIAHLLPVSELERYQRICARSAADDPEATGWRIAAAVCQFRLGNYKEGGAFLEEVRAVVPLHAEMLFFRVVAALHAIRPGTLTQDRVQPLCKHLKIAMELAPGCGLPELLAGMVARDYCEPYGLACPLGDARGLLNRASAKGISADDLKDLQALVAMPAGLPVAQMASQPQPPETPERVEYAENVTDFTNSLPEPGFSSADSGGRLSPRRRVSGGSWAPLVGLVSFCLGAGAGVGGTLLIVQQKDRGGDSQRAPLDPKKINSRLADLRVGDWVEYRPIISIEGQPGRAQAITYRYTIVEKTAEDLAISFSFRGRDATPFKAPPYRLPLSAKPEDLRKAFQAQAGRAAGRSGKATAGAELAGTAETKTFTVKGTSFLCRGYRTPKTTMSSPDGGQMESSSIWWFTDKLPILDFTGGLVQMEISSVSTSKVQGATLRIASEMRWELVDWGRGP